MPRWPRQREKGTTEMMSASNALTRCPAVLLIFLALVPAAPVQAAGVPPRNDWIEPQAGGWHTWVLTSGSELRPGSPPDYDSPEQAADLAVLEEFQRTPKTNSDALFWEYAAGGTWNYCFWNEQANKKFLEYRLDDDPPRAARAYARQSVASYDSTVACWDAKYTYWAIRPFQLDPTLKTLFPSPNHPATSRASGPESTSQRMSESGRRSAGVSRRK
jgi:hypothetical protein